jgi:hypothetical protein
MKQSTSQTRQRYKKLCGRIRRNGGFPFPPKPYQQYDELEEAAILTYDWFDSEFTGWINRQRMSQFNTRKYAGFGLDWLPF